MEIDSPSSIGVSTGFGIPTGGTDNQLLVKNSSTNYDTSWQTPTGATLILTELTYGNQVTFASGYADTILPFNVVVSNPNGWWNTSTNRFTPTRAGYYQIIAVYDIFVNGESILKINKNGSTQVFTSTTNGLINACITNIVYLNGSTDYVTIVQAGANANTRSQLADRARFQALYLGNW